MRGHFCNAAPDFSSNARDPRCHHFSPLLCTVRHSFMYHLHRMLPHKEIVEPSLETVTGTQTQGGTDLSCRALPTLKDFNMTNMFRRRVHKTRHLFKPLKQVLVGAAQLSQLPLPELRLPLLLLRLPLQAEHLGNIFSGYISWFDLLEAYLADCHLQTVNKFCSFTLQPEKRQVSY